MSDMEFTKISRGRRHRSGWSSMFSISSTLPVHLGPDGVLVAKPANGPVLANRTATRSA
jgi:hypothetical protein